MTKKSTDKSDRTARQLDDILRHVDGMPELDNRSPDEIVGYDENGVPIPGVTPPRLP